MSDSSRPIDRIRGRGSNEPVAAAIILGIQGISLAVFQFGDIGFDHRGRFGLDFNAFILISIGYAIALLVGLVCSLAEKHWTTAILQICFPLALLAFNSRPPPHYDAAQYQHLVGKSPAEVERILGARGRVLSFESHPEGHLRVFSYDGMTIKFSADGPATRVIPNKN